MQLVEFLGYSAAGAVFITFWMKKMILLRIVGIGGNLLFLGYGLAGGPLHVTLLHVAIFPLNCIRLYQAVDLRRRIQAMAHSQFDVNSLLPFMTAHKYARGSHLCKRGDEARDIYYLSEGGARIIELGIDIEPGNLVGEIAMFSPRRTRTQTVECTEDCVFLGISEEKVLQMYSENPEFGLYLIKMIVDRLLTNVAGPAAPANAPASPGAS